MRFLGWPISICQSRRYLFRSQTSHTFHYYKRKHSLNVSNNHFPNFPPMMDLRVPSGNFICINGFYYPAQMPQQMPSAYPNGGQYHQSPMLQPVPQQIPQQMPSAYPINGPPYPFTTMPQIPLAYTQNPQPGWQYQAQPRQQQIPSAPMESVCARAARINEENEQARLRCNMPKPNELGRKSGSKKPRGLASRKPTWRS